MPKAPFLLAFFALPAIAALGLIFPSPLPTSAQTPAIALTQSTTSAPAPIIDPTTGVARIPHPKPAPGAALTMTIKELGNFPFDPNTDATVPADVLALDGVKITLHGYIVPFQETQLITEFALLPTLGICCFTAPPGIEHSIICHAAPSLKVNAAVDEVIITGKLTVRPIREDGYTHTVFQLEVSSVTPAQ